LKRVISPAPAASAAPNPALLDPSFSADIIAWQQQHGRHALPWQNTRDAYRIWLSEIMLQQTQVATVIPYYERFLQRFPTVADLAQASTNQVMEHWAGLGYYTRARNLHACAKQVMALHGGQFPASPQQLAELPGIGRSTAAAIAAFSYGARAAILDGNVKRVFARVFGITEFPGSKAVEEQLWLRAEALLPAASADVASGVEAYTQGLMDLGATVCTRSKPACERCPLRARCVALQLNRVAELPIRKPKKAIPQKFATMLVVLHQDQILLLQRPPLGIWADLWSLPEIDGHQPNASAFDRARAEMLLAKFGTIDQIQPLPPISHGFTHFKLAIEPWLVSLAKRHEFAAQGGHQWLDRADLAKAALPAPVKKLLLGLA
jgi:A/G-specific adenine glycosylase